MATVAIDLLDMRCFIDNRPFSASLAGGAGARPDHSITRPGASTAITQVPWSLLASVADLLWSAKFLHRSSLRPPPPGAPGPFALSDEVKLKALASEAGLTTGAIVDVPCPWAYADLETALRGMLSAGPTERAIQASSFERAREAVAVSIEPYRTASGDYRLNNTFRYLVTGS